MDRIKPDLSGGFLMFKYIASYQIGARPKNFEVLCKGKF